MQFQQAAETTGLRTILERRVDILNGAQKGIFHVDVTADVEPFFAPAESLAEANADAKLQGFEPLKPMMDRKDSREVAVYYTRMSLVAGMFSNVDAVIELTFNRASRTLRNVHAEIDASSL